MATPKPQHPSDVRDPISQLSESYFIRTHDRAFATGRRRHLVYAVPCGLAGYSKVNASGPDPDEYLEFAKGDLQSGQEHGPTNAVGNAKRAVHLAVEGILRLHGLEDAYGRKSFPKKLELMNEVGILPVRLVNTLNQRRNLLEHEYQLATREEAESLVEAAEMFLVLAYAFCGNR